VAVTSDDLVGRYIGHAAPKTREVLKKAMGGVLFIDEAYCLYRPVNERDDGQEAIEILPQVMENQRDDRVVILAGYKDRMDTFFKSHPGMSSPIAHHNAHSAHNALDRARLRQDACTPTPTACWAPTTCAPSPPKTSWPAASSSSPPEHFHA
jgi:hypothetical protein